MARARVIEEIDVSDVHDADTRTLPNQRKSESEQAEDGWFDFLTGDREAEIFVYRQNGSGKDPMAYLFRAAVDKYTPAELMDYLRDQYGGGDYRIRPYKNGRLLPGSKLLTIESPNKGLAVVNNQSGDPVVMAVLSRLDALTEKLTDRADPMEEMKKTLAFMGLMKEAMGIGSAPPSPISQLKEMMATMEMMQQMRGMLGGGGEPQETGFLSGKMGDILEKSLPAILGALSRPASPQAPRQPRRPMPRPEPVEINPRPASAHTKKEVPTMTPQEIQYKKQLQQLCMACDMGHTPEDVADMIVGALTEEQADQMEIQLQGDFYAEAVRLCPELGQGKRAAWFRDLGEWLKGHFKLPSQYADQFNYGEEETEGLDNSGDGDQAGTEIASEPAPDVAPSADQNA